MTTSHCCSLIHHLLIEDSSVSISPASMRSMVKSANRRAMTAMVFTSARREAGVLLLEKRLAEEDAVLGVVAGHREGVLDDGRAVDAGERALVREVAHHLVEALARLAAEDAGGGDGAAVEEQLAGVRAVEADLLQPATDAEARGVGLEEDERDPPGALGRVGLRRDDEEVGDGSVG